jgi:hypothetical protein
MMRSKPLPLPKPKTEPMRPRRRKPMTIAAGFVCSDGLVLFADTEEQEGYTKTEAEKIQQYSQDNCRLVVANAGNGHLADSLIDRIFDELAATKPDEQLILSTIRKTILDFHQAEVALYPAEDEHKQVGLILGLQVKEAPPMLLHSAATALRKIKEFAVIGMGAEIKFLAQQMYQKGMPIKHAVLIANYLLETARDHVQGCGGQSRIATLCKGCIEMRHIYDVWSDKNLFSTLVGNYRAVLLSIPDEEITDEQYDNCLGRFLDQAWRARSDMLSYREFNKEMKQKHAEYQSKSPWSFERYYDPISDPIPPLDRRLNLPKYKSKSQLASINRLLGKGVDKGEQS